MKKLSTGEDSTLGNYRKHAVSVFGEDSAAVKYLDARIKLESADAEVFADEAQLINLLGAMHEQNTPLGATGKFPNGKVSEDDQGEIAVAIITDRLHGIVRIEFGKPIDWLGLNANQAASLAVVLQAKAAELG